MSAATGYGKEPEPSTSSSFQLSQQSRRFELCDILLATENFDESLVIGRGGFGKVYRGNIFNGSATVLAAIKRLDPSSSQGATEFWAEVEMLSKLRHCNLVSLFGYCNDEKEMILVYEYMPNGTLEDHLHKLGTQLSWVQRLNICIGACRGLHYLHTGTGIDFGVIHRDVNTSNILLQESWASKISDFGLSKIGPINQPITHVNTLVKGTFGYFDPDYYATGNLTRKSDVYAFGVVLLEVLCRKRAIFNINGEVLNLANWAQESIKKGSLKNIIDVDIRGQVSPKCSKKFVQIAKRCLYSSPKKRSTMAEVLSSLESILSLQEKFNNSVHSAGRTILFRMVNMLTFTSTSNGENTAISQTTIMANSSSSGASDSDSIGPGGLMLPHPNLRLFSFGELKTATRNFRSDTVLGEGAFGKVYKGWLEDKSTSNSTVIAVKKLNSESMQGLEEWQAEVNFLGRLSHPNLVKLLGYCYEGTELLLVYEFMQKGSLEKHLFGRGSEVQPLPWDIRLKISIEAARGLAFLHACEKQIIYRDFKASNILLDGSYHAKLSDFGLAKIGPSASHSHVTTRVMGTYGYAAPEYVSTGHLYVKSDVYGFGVVLVEMLTGLRALDSTRPAHKQNLIDWIKPFLTNGRKLKKVMDSRLEGRYPSKATSQIAQLASTCLGPEPKTRPSMKEIVEKLEILDAINERPKVPRVHH